MASDDDANVRADSPTIHELMPKVMSSIGSIHKDRKNTQQNFSFRGIDDVMNAVQPALTEHGVYYVPEVIDKYHERYETRNGTGMRSATITVRYTFYGPRGDSVVGVGIGEAADAGDKATSKALAMALKYALLQTFCVPTGDPDPDGQNVEDPGSGARRSRSGSRRQQAEPKPAEPSIAPQVQAWLDQGLSRVEILKAASEAAQKHGEKAPSKLERINTANLKAETLAALKAAIDSKLSAPRGCIEHADDPQPETCNACFEIAHGVAETEAARS